MNNMKSFVKLSSFSLVLAVAGMYGTVAFADRVEYIERLDNAGIYSNVWTASGERDPDEYGFIYLEISGGVKSVNFEGTLHMDCEHPQRSYWSSISNSAGAADQNLVPAGAIRKFRRYFCR